MNDMSDKTRPLVGLPGADRTLLANPPLELAVVEFRLIPDSSEPSPDLGLRFKERLAEFGLVLPRLAPIQQQRVLLNAQAGFAAEPQAQTGHHGWSLMSADGVIQFSLMPDAIAYQTSKYDRWSLTMRPAIHAVLSAVNELQKPALVVRIGVRYVNRFVDLTALSAVDWVGRLDEHFLGPLCHSDLGSHVKAFQQQVEFAFSDTQGALLRHGPFVDTATGGSVSYFVDIDVFDAEPTRFDSVQLVERTEVLNRTAATLFQASLKPEYLHVLQGLEETEKPKEVVLP